MAHSYKTELPKDYSSVIEVGSLQELFAAGATAPAHVNAIVWRRGALSGNFNGLAKAFSNYVRPHEYLQRFASLGLNQVNDKLMALRMMCPEWDEAYEEAALQLQNDVEEFSKYIETRSSTLRWVGQSGYGDMVDQYHKDGGVWRLMCCYNDPATAWIKNQDAVRQGSTDSYRLLSGATEYAFEPGDIWLHAGDEREIGQPFIHKATKPKPGEYRLLFAS